MTVEAASTPSEGTDDAPRGKATKKRESGAKRVGQGVHKGSGTDARRYRKTGRMYQFGARVKPDFAESVKVIAAANNVTIGELLEEMEKVYTGLKVVAADKKMSIAAVLDDLLKVCKVA